jgi:hypothetical protein
MSAWHRSQGVVPLAPSVKYAENEKMFIRFPTRSAILSQLLAKGRQLLTLEDAAKYIQKLPKAKQSETAAAAAVSLTRRLRTQPAFAWQRR